MASRRARVWRRRSSASSPPPHGRCCRSCGGRRPRGAQHPEACGIDHNESAGSEYNCTLSSFLSLTVLWYRPEQVKNSWWWTVGPAIRSPQVASACPPPAATPSSFFRTPKGSCEDSPDPCHNCCRRSDHACSPAVGLPAFADDKPAAQTQNKTQDKPSIAELEKAAAAAKATYDDAVKAESAAKAALEATLSDTSPLAVAAKAAETAAAEAAAAKVEADQAVIDAQAAVDALPETATEEEKAAAATKLTEAKAAAETAKETKAAADAAAVEAVDARDDERVAAARKLGQAQKATKEALADKTAADEALAKAKEEGGEGGEDGEDCVPEARLTTVVTGLPSTVVSRHEGRLQAPGDQRHRQDDGQGASVRLRPRDRPERAQEHR